AQVAAMSWPVVARWHRALIGVGTSGPVTGLRSRRLSLRALWRRVVNGWVGFAHEISVCREERGEQGKRRRDGLLLPVPSLPASSARRSARVELAVAGVAQAWADIAPIVQPIVEGGEVDVHARVRLTQFHDAIGRADQTYVAQVRD